MNVSPPASVASRSSTLGSGYLSGIAAVFIVCLKSPQILIEPSFLSTGTIGAAQSEYWTGSMTSAFRSLSSSAVTLSLSAYGTGLARKKRGRASC